MILDKFKFKRVISKKQLKDINAALKIFDINEKEIDSLDQLRNMLFLDGITSDNNCLINIAYDIDILLNDIDKNQNLNMIDEITEKFDFMIENKVWYCKACKKYKFNIKQPITKKLKWFIHFEKYGFSRPNQDLK